ncbi:unnamed protein product [Meloidogyne enterolobii]|uniref:Uncharacterized protein n=1 Tax=Meloidogyne enterolobii TaxID=390850 RepID=A0ACB1B1V0_MELEN
MLSSLMLYFLAFSFFFLPNYSLLVNSLLANIFLLIQASRRLNCHRIQTLR